MKGMQGFSRLVSLVSLVVYDLRFSPPGAVYEAFDPILQMYDVEVDQQSDGFAAQFEIRNNLSLMNRRDRIDRLDFDNHEIFDQQIHSIADLQFHAVVDDGKSDLARASNTRFVKLMLQAGLVGTLQQART